MELEATVIEFGPASSGAASAGAPRLRVQPRPSGRLELRVTGLLPPDWSLRVARGLAASRINLLSGYARRGDGGSWIGAFEALPPQAATRLDLSALARPAAPFAGDDPMLLDLRLEVSSSFGGSLLVEVAAWDAIGLLAGTLGCAAELGLHPAELILETQDECAFHQLALQDAGAGCPDVRAQAALARRLATRLGAG